MRTHNKHHANLRFALFIAIIALLFLFIQPVLNIFLGAVLITYVFYPLYTKLFQTIQRKNIAIILTLLVIVLIFIAPVGYIISQVPSQTVSISQFIDNRILQGNMFAFICDEQNNGFLCSMSQTILSSQDIYNEYVREPVLSFSLKILGQVIAGIPLMIANFGLALFISYFLFADGKKLISHAADLLPISSHKRAHLLEHFGKAARIVVFANLLVALAQGLAGAIGFAIFGVSSPFLWGLIMGLLSLFPVVGPAFVWMPVGVLMIIGGLADADPFGIARGIGLLIFGVLIISTVDNIIRIKVVHEEGTVHPLTILIGIIGGIQLFGIIGLFMGPVILSLSITFIRDFNELYKS